MSTGNPLIDFFGSLGANVGSGFNNLADEQERRRKAKVEEETLDFNRRMAEQRETRDQAKFDFDMHEGKRSQLQRSLERIDKIGTYHMMHGTEEDAGRLLNERTQIQAQLDQLDGIKNPAVGGMLISKPMQKSEADLAYELAFGNRNAAAFDKAGNVTPMGGNLQQVNPPARVADPAKNQTPFELAFGNTNSIYGAGGNIRPQAPNLVGGNPGLQVRDPGQLQETYREGIRFDQIPQRHQDIDWSNKDNLKLGLRTFNYQPQAPEWLTVPDGSSMIPIDPITKQPLKDQALTNPRDYRPEDPLEAALRASQIWRNYNPSQSGGDSQFDMLSKASTLAQKDVENEQKRVLDETGFAMKADEAQKLLESRVQYWQGVLGQGFRGPQQGSGAFAGVQLNLKPGVSLNGVLPDFMSVMKHIQALDPGGSWSSVSRDPKTNAAVKGAVNSWHMHGGGGDFLPSSPEAAKKILAVMKQVYPGYVFDYSNHGTGLHLHASLPINGAYKPSQKPAPTKPAAAPRPPVRPVETRAGSVVVTRGQHGPPTPVQPQDAHAYADQILNQLKKGK